MLFHFEHKKAFLVLTFFFIYATETLPYCDRPETRRFQVRRAAEEAAGQHPDQSRNTRIISEPQVCLHTLREAKLKHEATVLSQ